MPEMPADTRRIRQKILPSSALKACREYGQTEPTMENGINGAAKSGEESLNVSLTSGSTKLRGQVLRRLQEELGSAGDFYNQHTGLSRLLTTL